MAKEDFPEIKEKNEGKFTKATGRKKCQAESILVLQASKVMKNTKKYDEASS